MSAPPVVQASLNSDKVSLNAPVIHFQSKSGSKDRNFCSPAGILGRLRKTWELGYPVRQSILESGMWSNQNGFDTNDGVLGRGSSSSCTQVSIAVCNFAVVSKYQSED